jgi:anionic cell wall polymer biosynthesis LytR-Cps2A-Psr (LCP) family protein
MRRVAKVLAWLVAIVLVAGGGVAGGVWLYVNEEVVEPLRPDKGTDLASQDTKNEIDVIASPDAPAVALVIGYDVRKGADAAGFVPRSDTVMLMRGTSGSSTRAARPPAGRAGRARSTRRTRGARRGA